MTPRLRVSGKALVRALGRAGFEVSRIRGSHHFLRHPDGRATSIPVHAGETVGQACYPRYSEIQRFFETNLSIYSKSDCEDTQNDKRRNALPAMKRVGSDAGKAGEPAMVCDDDEVNGAAITAMITKNQKLKTKN